MLFQLARIECKSTFETAAASLTLFSTARERNEDARFQMRAIFHRRCVHIPHCVFDDAIVNQYGEKRA